MRCNDVAVPVVDWKRDATVVKANKRLAVQPRNERIGVSAPFGKPFLILFAEIANALSPVQCRAVARLPMRSYRKQIASLHAKRGDHIIRVTTGVTFEKCATV